MSDLNLSMFRAYDIRTPARLLSPALAERLGRAEARYFREVLGTNTVILSRDARSTGSAYLEQGIALFRDLGFTVYANPQVSSTCQFYYACMKHPEAAGIMYGASHNPAPDTGQKIVGPGALPIAAQVGPEGGLDAIQALYLADNGLQDATGGSVHLINYLTEYVDYALALSGTKPGDLAGCRILIDFLCGAAGQEMLLAFEAAGAEVHANNLVPDGAFPAGAPNPVVPEAVARSMAELASGDYHFGIFFDGDGDRVDFYAPDGRQLSPAFNVSAIAGHILTLFPEVSSPVFCADLKANPLALSRMAKQGLGTRVIRNGHSQIKESLRRGWPDGLLAAVEESSHYYMNFPLDGGIYPSENTAFYALLTARTWYANQADYATMIDEQAATYREREWGYKFPSDAQRAAALGEVEALYTARGAATMDRTADGMDMEATLIRLHLPFEITAETVIGDDWCQVAQRISQSENGLARWEVTAATAALRDEAVASITAIAAKHGAGERYVG